MHRRRSCADRPRRVARRCDRDRRVRRAAQRAVGLGIGDRAAPARGGCRCPRGARRHQPAPGVRHASQLRGSRADLAEKLRDRGALLL